jgi:hypothetical protein
MDKTIEQRRLIEATKKVAPAILLATSLLIGAACSGDKSDNPKISISEDGCEVNISGTEGMKYSIAASQGIADGGGKGGVVEGKLPSDGNISENSGGVKGMTTSAELYDESDKRLLQETAVITEEKCPPAGSVASSNN